MSRAFRPDDKDGKWEDLVSKPKFNLAVLGMRFAGFHERAKDSIFMSPL